MRFSADAIKRMKKISIVTAIVAVILLNAMIVYTVARAGVINHSLDSVDETEEYGGIWTMYTAEGEVGQFKLPIDADQIQTEGDFVEIKSIVDAKTFREHGWNTAMIYEDRETVTISVGYEVIYEVNTTAFRKALPANGKMLFSLPEDAAGDYVLTLRYENIGSDFHIENMYIGTRSAFSNRIVKESIFALILIDILAIVGLCLLAVVIFFSFSKIRDIRLSSLACLVLTVATWAFVDSDLPQLWCISLEFAGVVSNLSLALLPVSLIYFMWETCGHHHSSFRLLIILTWANVAFQLVFSMLGIFNLHEMLWVTHAVMGITVLYGLIASGIERKKGDHPTILLHAQISMIVPMVTFVISGLLYWTETGSYYSNIFLLAMTFDILLFFTIIIENYLKKIQKHRMQRAELEIYEDLALKDGMTDIGNRRAFEKRLKEYDESPREYPDGIICILDLNGLKKLNDDYGHTAGDEAIVTIASAITKTYGIYGECFRIGGDEFAVIITDLSADIRNLHRRFEDYLTNYNITAKFKLSVAKGCADLYDRNGRRLSTAEWKQNADLEMYADKQLYMTGRTVSRAEDLQSILDCIIGMVEAKDQYTAKHSERVREMSVAIGHWMNLSPDTIEQIDVASHLHDIGKVAIPESVLLKPGKLTDEEFEIMKTHSSVGATVIERAKSMTEIAAIVRHHHERYNGTGYPDRLAKEEIPLGARVVAVADSIDAMTSKRCYRDSLGLDVCRDEIERNLGIMYDPAIGAIVLEHWNDVTLMVQRG